MYKRQVVIHGEVAKPDSYPYADNMTLEDLIIQAGGLREAASVVLSLIHISNMIIQTVLWLQECTIRDRS